MLIWATGFTINVHSDYILTQKSASYAPINSTTQTRAYTVPTQGCFKWVTCANYFGEILEWAGFAIASLPNPAALVFILVTVSNLVPRALARHKRYTSIDSNHTENNRKAVIPYLL
jgi:3-oxo-5-alpha-steroid 4-dehydrogenase 1